MKNKIICFLVLLIIVSCSTTNTKKNINSDSDNQKRLTRKYDLNADYNYEKLKTRALQFDSTLDFFDLRLAYYKQTKSGFRDTHLDELKRNTFKALDVEDYQNAIKYAQDGLDICFVEMELHLLLSYAYNQIGNIEKSELHGFISDKLIESILKSGDGYSPETAYLVIDVREEYTLIRALRLNFGSQALGDYEGEPIDIMEVINPDNNERETIYFNVALSFMKMRNMFEKK